MSVVRKRAGAYDAEKAYRQESKGGIGREGREKKKNLQGKAWETSYTLLIQYSVETLYTYKVAVYYTVYEEKKT